MADRWSNPSGSVGEERFRVWPSGTDSYDHVELTENWDHLDAILGLPPTGTWPPDEGINGGIYALIKDLQDRVDDIEAAPPVDVPDVAYGVTLPVSPADGDEAILVNSTTNPSWQWRFRYNSGASGTYKWECIGGFPAINSVTTTGTIPSSSYDDLTGGGTGPDITVPLAGEYSIQVGCVLSWYIPVYTLGGAVVGAHLWMSYSIGGASPSDDDAAFEDAQYAISNGGSVVSPPQVKTITAASTLVRAKYRVQPLSAFDDPNAFKRALRRWMMIMPKRVS